MASKLVKAGLPDENLVRSLERLVAAKYGLPGDRPAGT